MYEINKQLVPYLRSFQYCDYKIYVNTFEVFIAESFWKCWLLAGAAKEYHMKEVGDIDGTFR